MTSRVKYAAVCAAFSVVALCVALFRDAQELGTREEKTTPTRSDRDGSEVSRAFSVTTPEVTQPDSVEDRGGYPDLSDEEAARIRQFVTAQRFHGPSLRRAREVLSNRHLPLLHSMLENGSDSKHWIDVVYALGAFIRDRSSVPQLEHFILRQEPWKDYNQYPSHVTDVIESKFYAIEYLGHLGGRRAGRLLEKLLTEEESRRLANAWAAAAERAQATSGQQLVTDSFREELIVQIRGGAAKGLAYTGESSHAQAVERVYEQRLQGIADGTYPKEDELISELSTALTFRDILTSMSFDEYLSSERDLRLELIAQHREKYYSRHR